MQRKLIATFLMGVIVAATPAWAKVSEQEAQALKNGTLTPLGAERKANADGSIPAWDGGLKQAPVSWKGNGKRLVDPFPQDQPLFTITADNLAQYKAKLSPGQLALFTRYGKTFRMPVYATRRTQINAPYIYDATYQNALKAVLADGSDALQNAAMGIPFPIPKTGTELIWNHKLRHTGYKFRRFNAALAVNTDGSFGTALLREDNYAPYIEKGMTPERLDDLMAIYFLQLVKKPAREAGTINLAWSPMDQKKQPQMIWQYNPGQKRIRRAPAAAYDYPSPGSDGLAVVDQVDMFNGALDRYSWKLVGKKEMYIPYNAYRMHSDKLKYKDLVRAGHMNPEHLRYELHRVWVLEATLRQGTSHVYGKRVFFLDEDSWSIVAVDCYDTRGELWRVQEGHQVMFYDAADPHPISAAEVIYDLQSNRYLVQTLNNEEDEYRHMDFPADYFKQSNLEKIGGG